MIVIYNKINPNRFMSLLIVPILARNESSTDLFCTYISLYSFPWRTVFLLAAPTNYGDYKLEVQRHVDFGRQDYATTCCSVISNLDHLNAYKRVN